MFGFRRRKRRSSREVEPPVISEVSTERCVDLSDEIPPELKFAWHMANYTGQTVTIFVAGGGASGLGFTGVLLSVDHICVRLLTMPGAAPAAPIGLYPRWMPYWGCMPWYYPGYSFFNCFPVNTLGSVACIPLRAITAFVHNSI